MKKTIKYLLLSLMLSMLFFNGIAGSSDQQQGL